MSRVRLTKVQRLQVEAAAEVLRPWGLSWRLAKQGPHMHMAVKGPRYGLWRLTISGTPRNDDYAVIQARQHAEQLVRVINARLRVWGQR